MQKSFIPKNAYKLIAGLASIAAGLALTGCAAQDTTSTKPAPKEVVLATHDSFAMSDELIAEFEKSSGFDLTLVKAGDAGELTNKLVLTKDAPIADAVFGIDNTFAGVAQEGGVLDGELTAVSFGDVCLNYDKAWFSQKSIEAPTSIKQLTESKYKGLTVLTNPTTSSPGLSFLAATVSVFGEDGWKNYWRELKANGVKIAGGWEDAYFTDFSGSSGKGKYPIVLSYSSSPAFEIRENGESGTASILDGCFRQTEFAGVLKNAKNPQGAKALVEFMLGSSFQTALPTSMYVYPAVSGTELPADWKKWATLTANPVGQDLKINRDRSSWLTAWSEIFG